MKLISLNTWAGRAGKENLLDFFDRHKDVDVFCLQEMWEGGHEYASIWKGDIDTMLITDVSAVLKEYSVFFRPHYMDWFGLAIFAKQSLDIREEGDLFVFKNREDAFKDDEGGTAINHARNIQYLTVGTRNSVRTIVNFHGLWNAIDKNDSGDRLLQSDNIIKFLKGISNPHILCGDFNLVPDGKSLKKLEEFGMKNLIKEYGITSTRSSHYKKPVRFADYTLVGDGIKINEFKVLPDEVSDHLAMYLDFE